MTARFPKTYCSQCGGEFGPGNEGFGHCSDHIAAAARELLAALKEADIALEAAPDTMSRGIARRKIRAALQKATGATQ